MYYLTRITPRGIDPFDAENPLIFGAGLLTGVLGGRMNVSGKSPESGYLGDSNVGGYFGAELAGTGYSHLVITGKSASPVYLYIENEKISFLEAGHLWGKGTAETQLMIREELRDEEIRTMCIGPAGENRVRFACLITGPKTPPAERDWARSWDRKNSKPFRSEATSLFPSKTREDISSFCGPRAKKPPAPPGERHWGFMAPPSCLKMPIRGAG